MELTTISTPLAALIGFAAGQLIALSAMLAARRHIYAAGRKEGFAAGYDLAEEELEIELNETAARCNSAERLLASTQTELRQTKDQNAQAMQDAREAYEAQSIQLADAQMLNDAHARLLRQSAGKLDHVAMPLQQLGLTDDARQVVTLAEQLRSLAGWLKPQTQPKHMERAA